MHETDYPPEQRADIEARVKKAQDALKELQLQPATFMTVINQGNDVFGMKPISFLQDLKFQQIPSPIQQNDLPPKTA